MNTALRIVAIQLGVAFAGGLLTFLLSGQRAAISAGIGGLISALTTATFAFRVFATRPDAPLKKVVRAFYAGEVQKIALTALLFFAVIKWVDVSFLPLFLTYVASLLAYWIVLPFSLTEPH